LCFFSFLPIIFVVVILLVLLILSNHPLHYFHTSLKRSRISSCLTTFLLFLLVPSFLLVFILFLKLFNVGIPNFPLSYLSSKIISNRRTCCSSSLLNWRIDCLYFSIFIVKLVFHCLLNGFHIFARPRFFLFSLSFNLLKFGFADILYFLLDFILVWASMNVISFKAKVHNELVYWIIDFVFAIKIVIHHSVRLSLRVGNNQSFSNCEVKFSWWESVSLSEFLSFTKDTWFSSSYY
jgi:hypothetical protein